MKQQINLYLSEFRIKKDPLTALVMAQVVGGVVAVMLLVSAFDLINRWRLNGALEDLQAVLVEETRRTDQLDEQLALRSQNSALTNRLEQAELRLLASQQIRDFLSETKLGNVSGFSEYFKDLSRASIDGLSITEFAFSEGGEEVVLSGQVVDSAMVPRYVANIERGLSPLKDQHFSPAISRENVEDRFFNFELSTSSE